MAVGKHLMRDRGGVNELPSYVVDKHSERSIEEIKNAAERLVSEFNGHNRKDAALSLDERFANSLVIAVRPWRPAVFSGFRRS